MSANQDLLTLEGKRYEFAKGFQEFLARGRAVTRFHTETVLRPQNIGDHSFGVAWLCWYLSSCNPSVQLLMAALSHDMAEQATGDMPSPTKRRLKLSEAFADIEADVMASHGMPNFEDSLTEAEKDTLKRADLIDGLMYCLRERQMGNTQLRIAYFNFARYYASLPSDPAGDHLVKVIGDLYDQLSE